MKGTIGVLLAVLLLGAAAVLAAPAPADAGEPLPAEANESAAAGEHLAGSLSAHQESVDRNLSRRVLDHRVDRAPNETDRARAVAAECERLDERLAAFRQRARQLERAHENGSMSPGEFRARMTSLDAEAETLADLAERCTHEAEQLPDDALAAAGVDPASIREVAEGATTFRRTELANRTFNVTRRHMVVEDGQPNGTLENGSAEHLEELTAVSAERSVLGELYERAEDHVEAQAPGDEEAADALSCARDHLDAVDRELAAARDAARSGDDERFHERIQSAREHLNDAEQCIERAYEESAA